MKLEQHNDATIRSESVERKCILVYGYSSRENEIIKSFSSENNINDCILIDNNMLESQVIDLILDSVLENNLNDSYREVHSTKFIIFNALSSKSIHSYINTFDKTLLEKPIYAVTTPTSLMWKFKDLMNELLEEKINFNH